MIKKITRFILLLDNQTKKKFLILILFVFLGSIVEIFSFGSIMPIIDIIINDKNSYLSKYDFIREFILGFENKLELLLYLTFFISIIFILKNLYLIFLTWFSAKFTNDVRIFFNSLYVNQILINPYSYHLKNDSSKIIRDSMGEVAAVTKSMIFPTILITLDLITFIGLVILISFTNFEASMLIFATLILFGFCYVNFFKKKLNFFGKTRIKNDKKKIKTIIESLRLIKIVNIKNKINFFLNRYKIADHKTVRSNVVNTVVLNSIRFLLEIIMVVMFLLLIFLAFISNYDINDLFAYLNFFRSIFCKVITICK